MAVVCMFLKRKQIEEGESSTRWFWPSLEDLPSGEVKDEQWGRGEPWPGRCVTRYLGSPEPKGLPWRLQSLQEVGPFRTPASTQTTCFSESLFIASAQRIPLSV